VTDAVDAEHWKRYGGGEPLEHQREQVFVRRVFERTEHDGRGALKHACQLHVIEAPFQRVRFGVDVFQEHDPTVAPEPERRAQRVLDQRHVAARQLGPERQTVSMAGGGNDRPQLVLDPVRSAGQQGHQRVHRPAVHRTVGDHFQHRAVHRPPPVHRLQVHVQRRRVAIADQSFPGVPDLLLPIRWQRLQVRYQPGRALAAERAPQYGAVVRQRVHQVVGAGLVGVRVEQVGAGPVYRVGDVRRHARVPEELPEHFQVRRFAYG